MNTSWLSPSIRDDFPALAVPSSCGEPLIYLDSGATALRPRPVIEAVADAMGRYCSGVHRSVHYLGDEATERYEGARKSAARWLGAQEHEIVFTKNATESLHFVARARQGGVAACAERGECERRCGVSRLQCHRI